MPKIDDVVKKRRRKFRANADELPTWWGFGTGMFGLALLGYIAISLVSIGSDSDKTKEPPVTFSGSGTTTPSSAIATTTITPTSAPISSVTTPGENTPTTTVAVGTDQRLLRTLGGANAYVDATAVDAAAQAAISLVSGTEVTVLEVMLRSGSGALLYLDVIVDPDAAGAAGQVILQMQAQLSGGVWSVIRIN
jgi:S-formylglutathione hydrolase FrmB